MAKNQLIEDMNALYTSPGHQGSDVSPAVQKNFPVGMPVEDALKQLKKMGFDIDEKRYDRARAWPSGKWDYPRENPYADPIVVKNFKSDFKNKEEIHYRALKNVYDWRIIFFVYKTYIISFNSEKGLITKSSGSLTLTGP